jgi:cation transport protein ChaC
MRLTASLVARVPPYGGESGRLAGRDDLPADADYAAAVMALLAGAPPSGEVWIFAYGSLIWNPGFDHVEQRLATIRGWRRSFCIGWIRIYRGTPERPGIMLGLDRGGSCRGVVFRLPAATARENLEIAFRREHPIRWNTPHMRWMTALTPAGPVRALVVVTGPSHPLFLPGLGEDVVVEALATATGERGSMAEYLLSTVEHLETRGIHDRYLWRLQERVAERLERISD